LWISGALGAKTLIVFARTAPIEGSAINGITIFLVPRNAPGVSVREVKTIGVHGFDTCEITFDDVALPSSAVLGEVGKGFRQVLGTLNAERLNGAAMALGIARGAHEHTLTYVKQREAFGRPIGAFQILQHRLVDGAIQLEATRGLLQRAAKAADIGVGGETLSAMVNVMASDAATSITDSGMRALAGAGYSREFPVQRYFRDCRLYTFAPLTDEMLRNYVGENHLGLPRSY
jgi:alkylation response protein AidB-like acyl-CoA dehydrogenase